MGVNKPISKIQPSFIPIATALTAVVFLFIAVALEDYQCCKIPRDRKDDFLNISSLIISDLANKTNHVDSYCAEYKDGLLSKTYSSEFLSKININEVSIFDSTACVFYDEPKFSYEILNTGKQAGVITISRVRFSKNNLTALVSVGVIFASLWGFGVEYEFEFMAGNWQIKRKHGAWIS